MRKILILLLLLLLGSIALDEGAHAIYDHMKLRAYYPLPNTAMGLGDETAFAADCDLKRDLVSVDKTGAVHCVKFDPDQPPDVSPYPEK
jgi:hypothetical protein